MVTIHLMSHVTCHLLGGRVNSLVAEGLSGRTGARSRCLIEVLRLLKNSSFCSPPTVATAGAGRGLPTGTLALGGGLEKSSENKEHGSLVNCNQGSSIFSPVCPKSWRSSSCWGMTS